MSVGACSECGGELKNLWPYHGSGEFEGEPATVLFFRCKACGVGYSLALVASILPSERKQGEMERAKFLDEKQGGAWQRSKQAGLKSAMALASEMAPIEAPEEATQQVFGHRGQDLLAVILWLA